MKNIKGFAIASDGNMKRIAITHDELDDTGKVTNSNVKTNRLVTDENVISAIAVIETYIASILE